MKAIRVHGPCIVSLDEIPATQPKAGEVLVRVKAAGICGSDIDLYRNDSAHIKDGRTKLPIITGHEWSGVVEQLGEDVEGVSIGDKVTGECSVPCGHCEYCRIGRYNLCENLQETGIFKRDGAFAEYITFPARLLHKFDKLSFEEAALIEPMTVSYYSAMRAQPEPTDNILVTGPGPIGLQTVQILKHVYHVKRVFLSGTRSQRLELGTALGADAVINVREEYLQERIRQLTDGEMLDKVIETSGAPQVFEQLTGTIRASGRIVLVGFFGQQNARIDWDEFILNEITIDGANGSPINWDDAIALAEDGTIQMKPLISHVLPLADFEKGVQLITDKKENVCKVILIP